MDEKKNILSFCKLHGLHNNPPGINHTRWNSLFDCLKYILENIDFFKGASSFFSHSKFKLPFELNDDLENKLISVSKILKPIIDFTNSVQRNFVNIGTVYCEIIKLQNNINNIDDENNYGFKQIAYNSILIRFSQTCDSVLAELGYIFTSKGRQWLSSRNKLADQISFKLVKKQQITNDEFIYLQNFNDEINSLLSKIEEISNYIHVDSECTKKSFLAWIKMIDTYVIDPIDYWKNNITSFVTYDGTRIKLQDLCSIALRILVLPGSEAICERCFSQLKLIHNYLRNTMRLDILDSLLRIKLNQIWSQDLYEDEITEEEEECEEEEEEHEEIDQQYN